MAVLMLVVLALFFPVDIATECVTLGTTQTIDFVVVAVHHIVRKAVHDNKASILTNDYFIGHSDFRCVVSFQNKRCLRNIGGYLPGGTFGVGNFVTTSAR